MRQILLTLADSGKSLELAEGERVTIRLPENPTTGYLWQTEATGEEVVSLVGREPGPPGVGVGGGREVSFIFEARGLGEARVRLKRGRSWVADESGIDRRFEVGVIVRG